MGVSWADTANPPAADEDWQEFAPGIPVSFLCLVTADGVRCLGMTRQLIGLESSAAPSQFLYCGNVGPFEIPATLVDRIIAVVAHLITGTNFRGLCGVDAQWDLPAERFQAASVCPQSGDPWPQVIEFNPRPTAALELFEWSQQHGWLTDHLAAFEPESPVVDRSGRACAPSVLPSIRNRFAPDREHDRFRRPRGLIGKQIVYADRDLRMPEWAWWRPPRSPWQVPLVADVSAAGTDIPRGAPLWTVFAEGESLALVTKRLARRVQRLRLSRG